TPRSSGVLPAISNRANHASRSSRMKLLSASKAFVPRFNSEFLPQPIVEAHTVRSRMRWYVTDAVILFTSSREPTPSAASACFNRPADTCSAIFALGRNQTRPEIESSLPKAKSVRVWSGSRPLNTDVSAFHLWPYSPAVTTPKLTWVESSQWCAIGASGLGIEERRCGYATGPSAGSPTGPPYTCQLT